MLRLSPCDASSGIPASSASVGGHQIIGEVGRQIDAEIRKLLPLIAAILPALWIKADIVGVDQ